jgi:hypothetical protein
MNSPWRMQCCDERAPEPARTGHRKPPYHLARAVQLPRRESRVWNSLRQTERTPTRAFVVQCQNEWVRSVDTGRVEERRGRRVRARFPSPLIKLDVPVSGIQLSDWLHLAAFGGGPR